MSIRPHDLLELSKHHAESNDEATLRMCASRAYYAAYHISEQISHLCPDVDVTNLGDHRARIKRFTTVPRKKFKGSSTARQIGYLLSQAYALRLTADYKLNTELRPGQVEAQNRNVSEAFDLVNRFAEEHLATAG